MGYCKPGDQKGRGGKRQKKSIKWSFGNRYFIFTSIQGSVAREKSSFSLFIKIRLPVHNLEINRYCLGSASPQGLDQAVCPGVNPNPGPQLEPIGTSMGRGIPGEYPGSIPPLQPAVEVWIYENHGEKLVGFDGLWKVSLAPFLPRVSHGTAALRTHLAPLHGTLHTSLLVQRLHPKPPCPSSQHHCEPGRREKERREGAEHPPAPSPG